MLETETLPAAPETKSARPKWRTMLYEFGIIVAGVLSALAAQAWWQGRQDRGREVDYLRQMLVDARTNESRLDIAIQQNFQALSGTFSALIAGGDLRLIRTDSLRALIVAYSASLEYERSMLAFYLQQAFGNPDRFVQAVPFFHRMFETGPEGFAREMEASGTTVAQLRGNRNLAAILFALQAANSNRLVHLRTLRDETVVLRRSLEAEKHSNP